MICEKHEANDQDYSGGEKLETTIMCLAKIYAWNLTVMECLGSEKPWRKQTETLHSQVSENWFP